MRKNRPSRESISAFLASSIPGRYLAATNEELDRWYLAGNDQVKLMALRERNRRAEEEAR